MARTCTIAALSLLSVVIAAPSAYADPLWFDELGTLHVDHDGNVITVTESGSVNANGTAVDCSHGIVKQSAGGLSVNCVGSGVIKIKDSLGNRVKLVGNVAQLEMADGREISVTRGASAAVAEEADVAVRSNNVAGGVATLGGRLTNMAQRLGGTGTRVQSGSKEVVIGSGGGLQAQSGGKQVTIGADGSLFGSKPGKSVAISPGWREVKSERTETTDSVTIIKQLAGRRTDSGIELDISDQVLFDFNSAAIKPKAAVVLAKVAQLIRNESKGRVSIEGHTDSVGGDDYNLRLSQQRANAVSEWLRDAEQIPADIIAATGKGELEPVAPNTLRDGSDSPEGRAKNRRVTIVIEN